MLVGMPEGKKRPLGRPRRRWKYNIRLVLREMVGKLRTGFRIGTSGLHL
jgi:hypothetical protein